MATAFYIRTNAGARDFRIVAAPRGTPGEANWRDVVAHRDGRFITDATLFKTCLVLLMREESRPRLSSTICGLATRTTSPSARRPTRSISRPMYEFDTPLLRFTYSSMVAAAGDL